MSKVILPILSAFLLSLSFSSFNLWQFAWCGFIPLFIALEKKSLRQSFMIAYSSGVIFWTLTVYWLVHVTLIGQAVLILYLSVYFGVFGLAIYCLRFFSALKSLFFIPGAWVLLEYVRSYLFTGFPWALTGLSQYQNLPVIQIADITGAWGVSFLIVFINFALYLLLRRRLRLREFLICAGVLFISLGYGFLKLSQDKGDGSLREPSPLFQKIKVSVVQGNIPQELKWNRQAVNFIQNNYKELTIEAAQDKPDLIIWPEASMPSLWGRDEAEFTQIFSLAKELKINLLVGAVSNFEPDYFNSALFIDKTGNPSNIYHKVHLVPFGEFVPFKNIFPFLQTIAPIGDIQPGKELTIFKQPVEFGVLICFEDLFPELSRKLLKRGAKFLVNITNDAWYKESSAPFQHLAASVFRAVENRVYLARAANTGISGFIEPSGRILPVARASDGRKIFIKGYRSQNIYLAPASSTFYNRYGDFFIIFCLFFIISVIRYKHV